MRKCGSFMALAILVSSPAYAKDKPLPDGIKIVPEAQVAQCTFVDIVSEMRWAVLKSANKSQRDALISALEKAKEKGANAAVMTSMTAHNNQHQVTLTAYKCPADAGA